MKSPLALFSLIALVSLAAIAPSPALAADDLEVSGWIPYWNVKNGTKEAGKRLSTLDEINPFAFSIRADGSLSDTMKLSGKDWQNLFKKARRADVAIIPTIMSGDGAAMHTLLSNPATRRAHVAAIVEMVEESEFDGVDIDYENKLAETNPYFSLFLTELSQALGDKTLSCTIESRTPLQDRYTNPPASVEYANDFKAINVACDKVKIMMYDQQTIDQNLNRIEHGAPYMPLSDVRWVEKAARLAMKDIDAEKISLAVPTYGFEYQLTDNGNGTYTYKKLWSFTPNYVKDIERAYRAKARTNAAGEKSIQYTTSKSKMKRLDDEGPEGERLLWWSDSGAIGDKVELAKRLGLNGISIFKIDGANESSLWRTLR